jgi:hypothetical protein
MDNLLPIGKIRDIAEKHTNEILFELGITKEHSSYTMLQYELVFHLYHKIKQTEDSGNSAKT